MIDVKLELPNDFLFTDEEGIRQRMDDALTAIRNDFIALVSEATPTARNSAMQGGWVESTREVSSTQVRMSVTNTQPYAYYVLNGTGPARANPGAYLVQWVDYKLTAADQINIARKAGMSEKDVESALGKSSVKFRANALTVAVAFIIGRARVKRGSVGNDFVSPIIEENRFLWESLLRDAITEGMQ